MADQGQWTKSDLRAMKAHPFLAGGRLADQYLGWQRNELLLAAGGFYVDPSVFLRMNGRNVVWCDRDDESRLKLNLDFRGEDDQPLLVMDSNDWLEIRRIDEFEDIDIAPHGHRLTVKAEALGIYLSIQFDEYSEEELQKLGTEWDMGLDQIVGPTEPFPTFFVDALEEQISRTEAGNLQIDPTILRQFLTQPPLSRWQLLSRAISRWPVTVCGMELRLRYPFDVVIRKGKENVGGWYAGHSIGKASEVVWDMQG